MNLHIGLLFFSIINLSFSENIKNPQENNTRDEKIASETNDREANSSHSHDKDNNNEEKDDSFEKKEEHSIEKSPSLSKQEEEILPKIPSFAPVVKKVKPAVVNIRVTYERPYEHPFLDPIFQNFFGPRVPVGKVKELAIGSGTIIRKDGIILTCAHVVKESDKIQVALRDGRMFDAKIIFINEDEDLAFLKLNRENSRDNEDLPTVELAEPGTRTEGDWAIAIGYPEGNSLVTNGIIASTDALLNDHRVMKVTADLGPGMSGGGVFDVDGKLIGVPNAILAKISTLTKHGFAIPSEIIRKYIKNLDEKGHIKQPWHGIDVRPIQNRMNDQSNRFGQARGVVVTDVHPKSPAAQKGLQQGDIITGINGSKVQDQGDFNTSLASVGVGEKITFQYVRDRKEEDLTYTVIEEPKTIENTTATLSKGFFAGVKVAQLTPQLARKYRLPSQTKGVVVVGVAPQTATFMLSLQEGDVIEDVNGKAIKTPEMLKDVDGTRSIFITINRRGSIQQFQLTHQAFGG